jgi:hypothetical protein
MEECMVLDSKAQFHVARGETCVGCYGVADILGRVERGELDPFDHVYDEDKKDWVSIAVHPVFAEHEEFWSRFKAQVQAKNKAQGKRAEDLPDLDGGKEAWFVLRNEYRFGPFEYLDLVKLMQEKSLHEWDYVWTKRFEKWTRLSAVKEFQPETIQSLVASLGANQEAGNNPEKAEMLNEVFYRRRFARTAFEQSILVHNNQKLFRGRSVEIGAGGLSLVLNEGDIAVGDQIHLHVKPSRETPAFNASCEVVVKRAVRAGEVNSPIMYGLKFTEIEDKVKAEIDQWATKANTTRKSEAA